jgi:hypothetical protein
VLWRARDWLVPMPGVHVSIVALALLIVIGLGTYAAAAAAFGLADTTRLLARLRARAVAGPR